MPTDRRHGKQGWQGRWGALTSAPPRSSDCFRAAFFRVGRGVATVCDSDSDLFQAGGHRPAPRAPANPDGKQTKGKTER